VFFYFFTINTFNFVHFVLIQNEPKNQEYFKEIFEIFISKPMLNLALYALFCFAKSNAA